MSDKMVVQQELGRTLASLVRPPCAQPSVMRAPLTRHRVAPGQIHSFKRPEDAALFLRTFYVTMHREWLGIDRHRWGALGVTHLRAV